MTLIKKKKLKLNIGKSAFIVINPKCSADKLNVKIDDGYITHKDKLEYLGVVISNSGSVKKDVKAFLDIKRPNVSIKFLNFCMKNRNAPLSVKLEVLERCVSSSLIYASETWGNNVNEVELIYRTGIKIALDIRDNINNEIIYIESGLYPLESKIRKMQLNFWLFILEYTSHHQNSALSKVIRFGNLERIKFLKYYRSLSDTYHTPRLCKETIETNYKLEWERKIRAKAIVDVNSRLGTYYRINPQLQSYVPKPQVMLESERKLITRFRTGSHSLNIEVGRYSAIIQENRLCKCNRDVQTVWHIMHDCPLTRDLVHDYDFQDLHEIFAHENIHLLLLNVTKVLKIPLGRM